MSPTHPKLLKINIPNIAHILWLKQLKNCWMPITTVKKENWVNKNSSWNCTVTLVKTNVSVHNWTEAWSDLIKLYILKWAFIIFPNFKIIKWWRIHSFSGFILSWSTLFISPLKARSRNIDCDNESISSRSSSNSMVNNFSHDGSVSLSRVVWIFL